MAMFVTHSAIWKRQKKRENELLELKALSVFDVIIAISNNALVLYFQATSE